MLVCTIMTPDSTLYRRRADDRAEPVLPARRLERVLGRSAGEWTVDDLVGLVKAQAIRIVSLMHVGSDGWLKSLDFVPRSESHLRDVIEGASGPTARRSSPAPASAPARRTSCCGRACRPRSSIRSPASRRWC